MDTKITATQLAKGLSDVLNRVRYRGEKFLVERNGEELATIAPVEGPPSFTVGDFVGLVRDLRWPDEDFGRDLEEAHTSQPKTPQPPAWQS